MLFDGCARREGMHLDLRSSGCRRGFGRQRQNRPEADVVLVNVRAERSAAACLHLLKWVRERAAADHALVAPNRANARLAYVFGTGVRIILIAKRLRAASERRRRIFVAGPGIAPRSYRSAVHSHTLPDRL